MTQTSTSDRYKVTITDTQFDRPVVASYPSHFAGLVALRGARKYKSFAEGALVDTLTKEVLRRY